MTHFSFAHIYIAQIGKKNIRNFSKMDFPILLQKFHQFDEKNVRVNKNLYLDVL